MHICRSFLRVQNGLRSLSSAHEKGGQKQKCCVYNFVQCTKCRCKIFCHVGLHLIHLQFYSLEMLYILLLNKERDLSFTLYLLQVLNCFCPHLLSADFSSVMNE